MQRIVLTALLLGIALMADGRKRKFRQSREAAPHIVDHPPSQTGLSKGIIALVCNATGNPRPRIEWLKDGKAVSTHRYEIHDYNYGDVVGSVLWVSSARKRKDAALYTCRAFNRVGTEEASARIDLIDENSKPSGFPYIDVNPTVKTVEKSRSLILDCAVGGTPQPDVIWYKDYKPLYIDGTRITMAPAGTLNILSSNDSDQGKYHCSAQNHFGTIFSEGANVFVRVRRVPPRFSISPRKSYDVLQNGDVEIVCVAVGAPMPYVKWQIETPDGPFQVLPVSADRPKVGRLVLSLKNVKESANYTCVATSVISSIKFTTEVRLKALPKPPLDMRSSEFGNTAHMIRITWRSGDLEPVDSYTLYYRRRFSNGPYDSFTQISSTSFSVSGLDPYVYYEFRVSAINGQGEGNMSKPFYVRTNEAVPSDAPEILTAYMVGVNIVMLSWSPPVQPNGRITSYKVYYTSTPSLPISGWEVLPIGDRQQVASVRNLARQVTYSFRVAAENSAGEGPTSETALVKTVQGVPAQPRNFRGRAESSTSIRLQWNRPTEEESKGIDIKSYIMYYNCNGSACSSIEKRITFDPTDEYALTNLNPNSVYRIRLAAQSVRGEGIVTPTIAVKTLSDVPSAPPQNVDAFSVDENSILVEWKTPLKENHNGRLTRYTVYYAMKSDEAASSQYSTNPNVTSTIIKGLTPFTTYDVRVSAWTEVGEGPSSAVAAVTTAESTPGRSPSSVQLYAINSTSVRVRWSPVRRQNLHGNLRGYQVAYEDVVSGRNFIVNTDEDLRGSGSDQALEFVLSGLRSRTRYSVSVAAFTVKGNGPFSEAQYVTTRGKVPSAPSLSVTKSNEGKAYVGWEIPESTFGNIISYALSYRCIDCTDEQGGTEWTTRRFDESQTYHTPKDVIPGWRYEFKLAASNSEGLGANSTITISLPSLKPSDAPRGLSGETLPEPPKRDGSPPDHKFGIKLTWLPLPHDVSNGPITGYALYSGASTLTTGDYTRSITDKNFYWFRAVLPEEKYEFQVAALTSAGEGPKSPPVILTVSEKPTDQNVTVNNFEALEASSTTVWLQWVAPSFIENPKFTISYQFASSGQTENKDTMNEEIAISGLTPGMGYTFTITMSGRYKEQEMLFGSSKTSARTTPRLMGYGPLARNVTEQGTVEVILTRATNTLNVEKYSLVVVPVESNSSVDELMKPDSFSQYKLIANSNTLRRRRRRQVILPQPYIAAEFEVISIQKAFVVGDARNHGGFVNKPLLAGQSYRIFVRAVLTTQETAYTSSPYSGEIHIPGSTASPAPSSVTPNGRGGPKELPVTSDSMWVIGPIVAAIALIVAIVAVICIKRKRGKQGSPKVKYTAPVAKHSNSNKRVEHDPVELRRQNCQTPGMMSHPPIPVAEMAAHVERLRANDNLKFSQEYESIDPGQQFVWEHSALEVNKSKNRYANVIAYDHSRLTLSPIDGVPGSDYINANYISGYRRQNAYIATQGPTRETSHDFWRMVWEQRSSVIVMMTKCEERSKVKCDQYWPLVGSETYGLMKVTLIDEMELATYCVRTLALFKNGSNDRREVKHFQFTAWPDHGVPEHPTPVLNFMRRVKTSYKSQPEGGPMVVHCSAGVGRAGCFICIDSMLERMGHENSVDIYGQVTCMRAERNYMVQTEDQYIFIHDALLEAINCGNTELSAHNLFNHLHKLTSPEGDSPVTGMEMEFKRLASQKALAARFVSANLPCNKFKNRLVNILPYEITRVCLQPMRGVEGSDYVNASFIDGYRQKRAYIATQGPLPETTEDFWRMLWEHNSTIVVMLTKLRESGRDKCHQYWPAERSARYQYFVVDPMSEYSMQQYILREFKVTDARDGQSRTVRQFQFTDWPEQAVPKSGEGFIDFIGQVHKTKEQFGQEGPITIHCSAGVGRTGVFITLSIALERMRFENLVDMFQTVKMLRTQRPAMVQTEDQYQFCYRAALEYLGSFDHYATA
ncbi:receptor-type tyrosine-protein phosphatase F-like isoform X2 [Clavelina lepadiformis]|uniref:receptor-type tyrosine-protein phosphatase F-like isoform X2 n=1 Tax=Clavelina lepadiformis TaxID=159417 RepID=UPI0040438834